MQKVRIIGPRSRLADAVDLLQDAGVLHLCRAPAEPPLSPLDLTPRQQRHARAVRAALEDVEEALARLADATELPSPAVRASERGRHLPEHVRLARRTRRAAEAISAARTSREEECERLRHLARALSAFAEMDGRARDATRRTFYLVLSENVSDAVTRLERALRESIGGGFELETRRIAGGEVAVALGVPSGAAERIEALLPEVGVGELELPDEVARLGPEKGLEVLRRRLDALAEELAALSGQRAELAAARVGALQEARAACNDWLLAMDAWRHAAASRHLFVLEGWLPESERPALERMLIEREAGRVLVEDMARETWSAEDVPVELANPRLFRPFEVITRRVPMPRYGSIDPTPYVAVFFPMFFGLILGDLAYGALLCVLSAVLWRRSRTGSALRSVAEIAAACGAFAMLFGLFFGELLGDLGRRWLGLRSVALSREKAFVPFLSLAVAIGLVHVVLGLVLGALSSRRTRPRQSLGRGLAALMLLLTTAALLAALNVLPRVFFTPAVVALLVTFPILIAVEGMIGAIELLRRLGNVLSYARIMALGTASVMLAVAANELVGAFGGVVVGVLFATLFHLVNFALGVFGPTIHALRLHFVEFFGAFYSPGGLVYRPLRHWRPADPMVETP